jgi:predicted XRE-type DNA-binding protein
MTTKRDYFVGSGNVFADLGLLHPEEHLAKADLAQKIITVFRERRLTQIEAAKLLGVDQPKISALTRGRISGFSIERLLRYLVLLGHDVEITVRSRPGSRSRSRAPARLIVAQRARTT